MRRVVKILFSFVILVSFIVMFAIANLLAGEQKRAAYLSKLAQVSGVLIRWVLGIKVSLLGSIPRSSDKSGVFFVCNHLSYLDGIILSSVFPIVFIGRSDLKDWPLLGIFTRLSGTIFVNRDSVANIRADISRIETVLKRGVNVLLFPEGTTTDGSRILPFKSTFLQAPITCQSPIVALSISYLSVNGIPVSQENKDYLYWYSETGFFSHLLKVFTLRRIEVEIIISEPIDGLQVSDRKTVRTILQKTIEENLGAATMPEAVQDAAGKH